MEAEAAYLDPVIDATEQVAQAVAQVEDPLWQLELAAHSAMGFAGRGARPGRFANSLAQLAASLVAMASLMWTLLRHGGTSPASARERFSGAQTVFAVHGEDSTRTRHLRSALAEDETVLKPVLLLGRPTATLVEAARRFDPQDRISGAFFVRPASFGSALAAMPACCTLLLRGIRETGNYQGKLAFRDRVAIAFRMALGATHARWWSSAGRDSTVRQAIFAHTGNADTSRLEQAMQQDGVRTVHAVHGTNIGWAFAGLSDVAVFPSGADARLAAKLPAYGRCIHLPVKKPDVSVGNGDWALLTSYTHLQHPAFSQTGSRPDCALVGWVRAAADSVGQDPARVFWRPHPQIELVPARERERLEQAIAEAGFTRWPGDLPYNALGRFSVAITTPSTVLTDGLRQGQPVIVASLTPLQRDLLYATHPLLVEDQAKLVDAIARVSSPADRGAAFDEAWDAIEPGDRLQIGALLREL